MQLDNNSLIMQWNTDINGNPVSRHIPREVQQISPTHNLIQLTQIPDEFYPLRIVTEDNIELREVKYHNEMSEDTFRVDYGMGLVYFHESLSGKMILINYYGRGVMLISDSRIFHRDGDTIADTWDNIIERSQDALDLIETAGGLANAIKVIDQKVEEGTKVADRIEDFITETQFYGYTITLSREAFVVKADDNGEVGKTETSSVYTDVIVYQGAKQIIPTLSITDEYGCTFKVVGQRVSLATIDVNLIKVNAVLNIDCGDGLVAKRVLEVTKVFDGVNQYQVSMTNPFYSFQANSEGYIEEDQSVECSFKVSKANIDYENYTVQIQNLPQGLNYKINKGSVVFTAITGRLLPSSGSCSVVLMIDGQSFNKPFTWNKTNKGQDAKSLTLVGNQIIRYEKPDYSDIPLQINTTVSAKVVGLSGTPTWSFYNGVEWVVLENETAMDLTFAHNDATIWADRKEVAIKCELEGYHDELTIVKLANGSNGNDAITVILTNESHTVSIDDSGYIETSEIENARTNVLAYKGTNSVTPRVTKGKCVGCDVAITDATVQLISLDNSFTSSTAELLVEVDDVAITKVWTISKSKQGLQGESGQNGKSYILNVTGGTRSVTYSQINHDPRPASSSTFVGALYEDGEEILEDVSWYWLANGHFEGSSIDSNFTPTIKQIFDESVINNSISVMATYNGQTLTQEIPLSVTKDAHGLDWVAEWDSTKVDVRGSLILTPKIFAGHYDQENDLITGVAIGQDVLNNGRTIGVVGYQNNIPSFLLDTDGSLQVGNPFGENSTGLYYSDGIFKLKVNELSIEGAKVPTENEIGNLVTTEVNSAKNEIQESINGLNNSLGSLEDVVNNSLRDGILTEVEKQSLKTVMDTLTNEMNTLLTQVGSVLVNPFLSNVALMQQLQTALEEYQVTYDTLLEVYTRIISTEAPTDEDSVLFNDTILQLSEKSEVLNQLLIDCLTDISQTQAQKLVDKAKEEIQAEVSDVNDALSNLENTINTDFKAGLVTSINIANLENQLQQLAKEKADLDSQYNVIYNNTNLSNTIKSKLLQAKSNYDIAHDTLVAKINTAIADNLMTKVELEEINKLIIAYGQKLATYSGVAQEANADIALNSAQAVVEALDQEAIFNKLTNNGEVQGIYLQDGKVYINGEYVNTRNLKAVKDDGTETFKIDSQGNVSIKANSFTLTSGATTNVATTDYVNNAVSQVSNGAINIILSNESQVISTNASSVPLASQSFAIKVQMYKSTNEVTDFTIGTVSSANGITASVSQSTKTVTFSVSTSTTIGAVSGKIAIPIVYDGKTYSKEWSWAIAKQGTSGTSGSAGADAKAVDIIASSQVFKSTDGGTTFSPSTITLTPKLQNLTYSNWQYSTNGGSSWITVSSGSNGLTISGGVLTVSKDSALYTSSVTSISFRVNTNDSAYYDVVTIVKLYDVADVDFDQIAQDKVDEYDKSLKQLKVFNKLTNNGQTQGIYLDNSKLYINGEYIKANSITANKLHTDVLSANSIVSTINGGSTTISGNKIRTGSITANNGKSTINLDTGAMNLGATSDTSYLQWTGSDLNIKANSINIGSSSVATNIDLTQAKNDAITSANNTLNTTIANYYTKEETNSQISLAKDAIELGVSNTYETKTSVSSQVSSALTSAKSYTDTAKSSAISTASSDATSKANSALSSAKSYADSKKTEAINSAKDTLDATIANYYTKTQTDSAIKATSDSITQSVSSTYATKTELSSANTDITNLTNRIATAESKITDNAITNVVKESFYTKEETENAITTKGYATSTELQQTATDFTYKFSQSGGYNLFRNSAFKNDTTYWWLHQYNNPNGNVQIIPYSDEYGFPDRKVNTVRLGCDPYRDDMEYGIAQNVDTVIGKTYTVSCYVAAHRVRKGVIIVRDWNGSSWLNAVTFDTTSTGGNGSVYDWQFVQVSFVATANNHNINICMTHTNDNPVMWIARPQIEEGEFATPWTQHANEICEGIVNINMDGVKVSTNNGAYTQFSASGMDSFNNSSQQTLGIKNGGITFHPYNTAQLGAYITQSALWGGSVSANGLAISTANNGTYISLGTSSLSNANTSLNMDQALTISASDGFQSKGINLWKDTHAHGYGIRQLSHLKLDGSGVIQFDYLNNSPSTIYEDVNNGHSLYVMGGYQMHLGCMDGQGTPKGVIWMQNSTSTHSYTHWDFHNYTMYNMKTATSYANTLSNRTTEVHGVNSNVDGIRYLYRDIELVDGKAVRSIPNAYKGCSYDIVSIVCKGKGNAWIENEDENKFEINGECRSVNVEVIIYPASDVMTISSVKCDEAPELTLPKNIEGEIAPMITN